MITLKFLLIIVFCDPDTSCNGNGVCNNEGTCQCDAFFYGDNCISKLGKLGDKYSNLKFFFFLQLDVMISLRVAIMVHAVRLENANVMKGSMVTIAQVIFITC